MTAVTLLTKADCDLCDQAKATLERVAADYHLTIDVVALDSPRGKQLAIASGIAFPPALLLDGKAFSYGRLSERQLRKALQRADTATNA